MVTTEKNLIIETKNVSVFYGDTPAVSDISLGIEREKITALIGPSGCGKTTLLRSFNRMNDLIPIARTSGEILFEGHNIYCLLYTSPSPRDGLLSRMPSSA